MPQGAAQPLQVSHQKRNHRQARQPQEQRQVPFIEKVGQVVRTGRIANSIVTKASASGRQIGPNQRKGGAANTQQEAVPSTATRVLKPGKTHGQLHVSCGVASMRGEVARLPPHQLRQPRRQHRPRQPRRRRPRHRPRTPD